MTIRKMIGSVLGTLLFLTLAHTAQALPLLTLIPAQTTVFIAPGHTLDITGSIINRTNTGLDATELFLNFSGFDPGVLAPLQTLGQAPFNIPSFTLKDDIALFTIGVVAATLPGPQSLDVFLQDVYGNFSDAVTLTIMDQVPTVPEPSTLALMLAALPVLVRRCRHFANKGGHHGHCH